MVLYVRCKLDDTQRSATPLCAYSMHVHKTRSSHLPLPFPTFNGHEKHSLKDLKIEATIAKQAESKALTNEALKSGEMTLEKKISPYCNLTTRIWAGRVRSLGLSLAC